MTKKSSAKPRSGTVAESIRSDDGASAAGFICLACGREHRFPGYVLAHWSDTLTHACDCGLRYSILKGRAKVASVKPAKAAADPTS